MGSDITWKKLDELTSKIGSGATPRGGSSVYIDNGVHLIRSQNVYNDGFSKDGLVCITDKHAEELSNVEVEEEDILLNITGASVGRLCQVPKEILPARVNQHVAIIRPNKNELDPLYLRYFLISSRMQEKILSYASAGATRQALTKSMIEDFRIPMLPITEQRKIGKILNTFDLKIQANQKINNSLETIARAVFKSWFMDFDPVRAKMAGEPYPLPDEIMALFPDELVDSELGMIPKGWEVKKVEDYIKIQTESINPSEIPENRFHYYSIPAYDQNYVPLIELGKNIQSRKYIVKKDSLLFSKLNPSTPRIWFPINCGNNSICSTEFLVVLPKTFVNRYFLYFLFSSARFVDVARSMVTGTSSSHQRLKQRDFLDIKWIKSNQDIVLKFSDLVKSNLDKITLNNNHNKNYQVIRDILINRIFT